MENQISSHQGAKKTVFRVVSISATSKGTVMEDVEALEEFGFTSVKASGKNIAGLAPADEIVFLIEYDGKVSSNQKTFTLMSMHRGNCLQEFDSGRTIYIQGDHETSDRFTIAGTGSHLSSWDFTCVKLAPDLYETYRELLRTKGILPPRAILPKGAYRDARAEVISKDEDLSWMKA